MAAFFKPATDADLNANGRELLTVLAELKLGTVSRSPASLSRATPIRSPYAGAANYGNFRSYRAIAPTPRAALCRGRVCAQTRCRRCAVMRISDCGSRAIRLTPQTAESRLLCSISMQPQLHLRTRLPLVKKSSQRCRNRRRRSPRPRRSRLRRWPQTASLKDSWESCTGTEAPQPHELRGTHSTGSTILVPCLGSSFLTSWSNNKLAARRPSSCAGWRTTESLGSRPSAMSKSSKATSARSAGT